jgi:hypothetical protein
MTTERYVRMIAGSVVLLSVALGAPGSSLFLATGWLWLTAFAGANLLQSSVTGFCLPVLALRALGVPDARPPR